MGATTEVSDRERLKPAAPPTVIVPRLIKYAPGLLDR
jgi:hypothetical protein